MSNPDEIGWNVDSSFPKDSAADVFWVTFVIQSENRADVLPRVVTLFHRLNVEIAALYLVRRPGSETMHMSVTVDTSRERAVRLQAHLYRLALFFRGSCPCRPRFAPRLRSGQIPKRKSRPRPRKTNANQ
jgi:hypothetical protein